ncbi:glyoxylase-like metal-dependent hydrolase (beta-lactamase superfamily II) [Luteibacter jiangsuensis]|uniref:Glyoxylase-like metal-dependent hydrolase (Beta-lactamase superfamily II) n=1 Tax=Luteibacter jiangsuensis TaxID=637577 RepID=A0ABT9ST66_9GAMM|nr:MBL fold metallo-hydrolase [Luteibacter jiangsuensis]MDQ0008189.1 glyoxylase-like metal-dependent hydrolase (beta-lactamase superfamily II) [Luteibacter jiangsuensis]
MTPSPTNDTALRAAQSVATAAHGDATRCPKVTSFFDEATFTVSHVVADPASTACAIIDSVLDFDAPSGRTATRSAQQLLNHVNEQGLQVQWILETHPHADHLTAAPWLHARTGGLVAIGDHVTTVQRVFGDIFNEDQRFARDGRQFDRLWADGDTFRIGGLDAVALHVPGHTPACVAYVIGDAVFVGDTLFMPDYGTARCDFPGGDARTLYRSIHRLMSLPEDTRLFMCHDYKAPGRDTYAWESTVGKQRSSNIHVHAGVDEETFVRTRKARDATLPMPRLMLPSIQVNMRAGHLPEPDANGVRYLKLPLDLL